MESNNQNFQFKTNINCSGCVTKVTPFLTDKTGINHWEVDVASRDKVLTVKTDGISEQEVIEIVEKSGFKIEPLKS
ncbi:MULTISPECIES: heavy-metal-associated domain-containing protein [Sphingobacterium]|jgi:copper chaperone|uniref:Heavy-metal-associated domain-containing protein n=1 Tax=Sphingobacterium anhuiense TaxID=493780 RepID=A0ABW5YX06_9SPHI|nr:heavy-metal-associated domain-containing protein [Sphingobacterium sp. IITKGP-BTPF85]KKX49878.1 heavy metal-associated protein [Sphingobacterium sp. IITKGP-BTPF85]